MKVLPTIYKMDSTGKIREWTAQVEGSRWRTVAGVVGGSMVTSGWTDCIAKSQDTDEEQALFEANAARDHKLAREYYDNIEAAESGVPAMFKPMLATDYKKIKPEKFTFPCLVQPKLDGIRCIITSEGAFTRQNKPIHSIPHILELLEGFFIMHPDTVLDGELYNHELKEDFQQITSIVRREKFKDGDLEKSAELIQFHIYDAAGDRAEDETNQDRMAAFVDYMDNGAETDAFYDFSIGPIRQTPTYIAENFDRIDELHGQFTEDGFEGSIIRLDGTYENKRSRRLIKRKDFDTAEFTIERVEEGNGNWKGYAKRIVYKTADGQEFGSGVRGSQAQMKQVLDNASDYEGTIATVRYFGLTDDGIPRFPVTIDFHGESRVD